jgi:signal peptidase II
MNLSLNFSQGKKKIFKKENIYLIFLILSIFLLDRYSKLKILNGFSENTFYINEFINFNLIWNTGIGFGLLNFSSNLFYNLISILIGSVIIILFYVLGKLDKYEKYIFSIIIGGALGNFYDRIYYMAVPDFIDLHYGNFHWFTFNVADIFITIGITGFLMKGFFIKNN